MADYAVYSESGLLVKMSVCADEQRSLQVTSEPCTALHGHRLVVTIKREK